MTTQYKWLPSEQTDEMLKVLRPFLPVFDDEMLAVLYTAAWQAAPEVEQEPAVYLVWHDGEFTYTKYPEEIVNAYEILPLYSHPQPKQEPLKWDVDTIHNIIFKMQEDGFEGAPIKAIKEFITVIEKAHGIGVEK